MKKIKFVFIIFLALVGCKSNLKMVLPTPAGIYFVTEKKPVYLSSNANLMETPILDKKHKNALIIYYDKNVETKKILKYIKRQKGSIVERYEMHNAMAVSFPEGKSLKKIAKKLGELQGVIAIQQIENQS